MISATCYEPARWNIPPADDAFPDRARTRSGRGSARNCHASSKPACLRLRLAGAEENSRRLTATVCRAYLLQRCVQVYADPAVRSPKPPGRTCWRYVMQWSDDDALAMAQAGGDLGGNLIVGEAAAKLWLAGPCGGHRTCGAGRIGDTCPGGPGRCRPAWPAPASRRVPQVRRGAQGGAAAAACHRQESSRYGRSPPRCGAGPTCWSTRHLALATRPRCPACARPTARCWRRAGAPPRVERFDRRLRRAMPPGPLVALDVTHAARRGPAPTGRR